MIDLENREQVLNFASKLESYIDYDKAEILLNEKEQNMVEEKKNLEEMEIEYD